MASVPAIASDAAPIENPKPDRPGSDRHGSLRSATERVTGVPSERRGRAARAPIAMTFVIQT